MKIINNPIDFVIKSYIELYGENLKINIMLDPFDFDEKSKKAGCCEEIEKNREYSIFLNPFLSIQKIASALAHELAHTIFFDHSNEFDSVYKKIMEKTHFIQHKELLNGEENENKNNT